jgi:hypothetical protein
MTTDIGATPGATSGVALVNKINAPSSNQQIAGITASPGNLGTPVAASAGYRGLFLMSVDNITYGVTLFDTTQNANLAAATVNSWWQGKVSPVTVQPGQVCAAWLDPNARMVWTPVPTLNGQNGHQQSDLADATVGE